MTEGTLVASSTQGRYCLGEPEFGREITAGQPLAIMLNEQWIEGSVEYAHEMYTNMGMQYLGELPRLPRVLDGYYFIGKDGGICGLCVGMKVRLP